MSKFNKLDMAKEVAKHPQIVLKNHFFGLFSNTVYAPTSSEVESYSNYYQDKDALLFRNLIDASASDLEQNLKPLEDVETKEDGKYRLDLCVSHDGQFIAMQLNEVVNDVAKHLTPVRYFIGEEAQKVDQIF